MEKLELLDRINKFVAHSKKVHESSREVYQHTIEYAKTLEKIQFCKTSLADLSPLNSKYQVAKRFYSLRKDLKEILPNPCNDSYESSLNEYETLLEECQATINIDHEI